MVGDIDEGGKRAAVARGQFGIGADAADMGRIAQRQHASAKFPGTSDGTADGIGGHALPVATASVDHQQRAGVKHSLRRLVGDEQAVGQKPHIGWQHADAMRVMAGEIGAHQMIGDFGGLGLIAAHPASDQVGDGAQCARLKGKHRARVAGDRPIGQSGGLRWLQRLNGVAERFQCLAASGNGVPVLACGWDQTEPLWASRVKRMAQATAISAWPICSPNHHAECARSAVGLQCVEYVGDLRMAAIDPHLGRFLVEDAFV